MYECIYRPCFFNLCECCLSCYFLHFRPRQFPLAQLKHTSECQMFYEFALAYIYILCNKFFIFLTGEVEIYTSVSIKYSYILYNIESIRYFQLILSLHSGTNIIFFFILRRSFETTAVNETFHFVYWTKDIVCVKINKRQHFGSLKLTLFDKFVKIGKY